MRALNVLAHAWEWNGAGLLCCAALLVVYFALEVWKRPRSLICFLAAEILIAVVVCSPLDALARQYLLSGEAVERVLIALVAPYLLVLAIPPHYGVSRFHPDYRLTWITGMAALVVWFVPRLLNAALASPAVRLAEIATLLVGGMAFWWPLHSPYPQNRIRLMPTSLFYLAAATIWCSLTGLFLAFMQPWWFSRYVTRADTLHIADSIVHDWSLSPEYDQQTAGLLFWLFAGFCLLSEVMLVYLRWYNSDEVRHEGNQLPAMAYDDPLKKRE